MMTHAHRHLVSLGGGHPLDRELVQAGWRWVFIVNVPIGIGALLAGSRLLHDVSDRSGARPDVVAAGLFSAAIAALTLAIVKGQPWGWGSPRVIAPFAGSAVLVLVVAIRSTRHPAPLIEPVIVRTRAIALANLGALLFFSAFGALLLGSVLFQTSVWHDSVLRAGLQITPGPAMAALFAFPGGVLGQRFGQRYVGFASVRDHLSELVDRVEQHHERVVITRNGREAAVLLSVGPVRIGAAEPVDEGAAGAAGRGAGIEGRPEPAAEPLPA